MKPRSAALDAFRTPWIRAFTAFGPLPDANETRIPLRQNALDPGFHGVPAGAAHPDREADGVGVTGVRFS
jgi:hypothetical protein